MCTILEDIWQWHMLRVWGYVLVLGMPTGLIDINLLEFDAFVLSMHASMAFVGVELQSQQQTLN